MADIGERFKQGTDRVIGCQVRYRDASGKQRHQSFRTMREAREFAGSVVELVKNGHVHDRDTITVAEALELWIDVAGSVGWNGREPVTPDTL